MVEAWVTDPQAEQERAALAAARIASAAGMSRAAAEEAEMPSAEGPVVIADQAREPAATVGPQAWEDGVVAEAASAAEADEGRCQNQSRGATR